jgi:hypothetical protein
MFLGVFFSCFARPDSFSAIPSVSGPVFMFYSPRFVFGGTEGLGSRFHVLLARTHFRRYRRRRVPFSCIARPDSFSVIPRASGPVFIFCATGLVFAGSEGVRSSFHVLRSRTHFRRFRGRRVPFSCFALPNMFLGVSRASCLVFGGTEGVGSHFHVLRALPHFRRYRVRRVLFSCFARQESFSAIPSVSGPILIFSDPGHVFGSLFFMFCTPRLVFGDTECIGSCFHVLLSRTSFWRY